MKKKILYVVTKSVWGGAQQYVYDLAVKLPKHRFEAAVAAGGDGLLFDKLHSAEIRTISIPGLQRDVSLGSEIIAVWHLARIFIREQPDVIHLSSTKAAALGAAAVFIFKLLYFYTFKPRVVFTVHGWGFREERSLFGRTAIFAASWITCLLCDRIILINRTDYNAAMRFIPKHKLTLIPHGLRPIQVMSRNEARAALAQIVNHRLSDGMILIGTIAELTRNKGLPYLIEALAQFYSHNKGYYRGLASIVIGEGEERQNLERLIESLSLGERMCLAGFIPDAGRFLTAFDIFVLPSVKEGLPYALMQAMAAGLPIVATSVGGIPDLIADEREGLLVPPKDRAALGQALARLLSSPARGASLGAAARRKIKTKFLFRDMVRKTFALYADSQAH